VPETDHGTQVTSSTWAPPPACYGDAEGHSWYRVAYLGGIEVRMQPSVLAPRSGVLLNQNEVFAASAEIVGADGRIYLKLADGRGWVFHDSALMPHDPSVVRGHFATVGNTSTFPGAGAASHQPAAEPAPAPYAYSTAATFPADHSSHSGTMMNQAQETYSGFTQQEVIATAGTGPLVNHVSTSSAHIQAAQSWPGMVNDYQAAWVTPVTKDCPPMWEPSVGPSSEQSFGHGQWTQHS